MLGPNLAYIDVRGQVRSCKLWSTEQKQHRMLPDGSADGLAFARPCKLAETARLQGFLRSWEASGLREKVVQRVNEIVTRLAHSTCSRTKVRMYVTGLSLHSMHQHPSILWRPPPPQRSVVGQVLGPMLDLHCLLLPVLDSQDRRPVRKCGCVTFALCGRARKLMAASCPFALSTRPHQLSKPHRNP